MERVMGRRIGVDHGRLERVLPGLSRHHAHGMRPSRHGQPDMSCCGECLAAGERHDVLSSVGTQMLRPRH